MIENFTCPDGNTVSVNDCIQKCKNRCLTLPTLIMASKTRKWDGKTFSVTQLLQPTLQSYLKIKYPETISPMGVLAAALGTSGHALLEGNMPEGFRGEFRIKSKDGLITGQPDCIDVKNGVLYDYKFVAAFSLARMLGMKQERYQHELLKGKNKGKKEWRVRWVPGGEKDFHHYDEQLNMYRVLLEDNGIKINKMILQVMAKESLAVLKSLGLDRQAYLIEIPKKEDWLVRKFFDDKYKKLYYSLKNDVVPSICDETWNGRRCKDYCSVNAYCPYYGDRHE